MVNENSRPVITFISIDDNSGCDVVILPGMHMRMEIDNGKYRTDNPLNRQFISIQERFAHMEEALFQKYANTFSARAYAGAVEALLDSSRRVLNGMPALPGQSVPVSKMLMDHVSEQSLVSLAKAFTCAGFENSTREEQESMAAIFYAKLNGFVLHSFENRSYDFSNALSDFYAGFLLKKLRSIAALMASEYWNIPPVVKKEALAVIADGFVKKNVFLSAADRGLIESQLCSDPRNRYCEYYTQAIKSSKLFADGVWDGDSIAAESGAVYSAKDFLKDRKMYVIVWGDWGGKEAASVVKKVSGQLSKDNQSVLFLNTDEDKTIWLSKSKQLSIPAGTNFYLKKGMRSHLAAKLDFDFVTFIFQVDHNKVTEYNIDHELFVAQTKKTK